MRMEELIHRKKCGHELSTEQIRWIIAGYAEGRIPDYQMAAFLMAVWFRGMSHEETGQLTQAMLESGNVLDLSSVERPKVDKHSTGGVGDKVSLILAPLAAAAGVAVPMVSGRALGHTGGTLDKLESIPGFRTDLSADEFIRIVGDVGCCIMGQTEDLAPADGRLYALRDVTSTVDCLPLIASSIMSKKLAEGCDALVLDVKVGRGSFTPELEDGVRLARLVGSIGTDAGRRVTALLTDMEDPLGQAVGNSLEVAEAVDCLKGEGPDDVREVTVALAAEMLILAGIESDVGAAKDILNDLLDNGTAYERMLKMVKAQGGDPRAIEDCSLLPAAEVIVTVEAQRGGYVAGIDAMEVGRLVGSLGAGRVRVEDAVDPSVGVRLLRRRGDPVNPGDPLAELHASAAMADDAARELRQAFAVEDGPAPPRCLIRARADSAGVTVFG